MAYVIQVSGRWADTLQVEREISSGETISNSSAKAIASWYATLDSPMYKLAHGEPVGTLRLNYEILSRRREYEREPDSGSARDIRALMALSAWLTAQMRKRQAMNLEMAGLKLTPRGLVRL